MAIFRCKTCSHLREVPNTYIGKLVNCPRCKKVNQIHGTVEFIEKVIERYLLQYKELQGLRQQLAPLNPSASLPAEQQPLVDIDIYNTTAMASSQQYKPILTWFQERQIQLNVNHQAIDTTGFFDEVAMQLGDNHETLQLVSDQIKYIQQKGYTNATIRLSKKSQKDIKLITQFCKELYNYSFVAKYFYQKQEKIIRLTLQTAPTITAFFNGAWMEWYVFMKLLEFVREQQLPVACLRSLSVTFSNEDTHELDVFFLVNNRIPICIECKTGEFRQHIDKYSTMRKRLKLEKTQFLLCVIGLSEEQTQGLSSMYDVTFVNEKNFLKHVEHLLV
ncbi:DUF1887 family protein [Nodosilinea sp. LEGE 07088]|nr:DUF1887 family protein [Nodosilinea sp. LEGE 07088]